MKKRPDYSKHDADSGILIRLFPQLAPLAGFFGKGSYTRASAPLGILLQFIQALAAAVIFMACVILMNKIGKIIPFLNTDRNGLLTELAGLFIGLPTIIIILVSLNRSFDLFYLFVTGNDFDKCGDGLKPVKSIMLVLGFIGSMAAALVGYFYFQTYAGKLEDKRKLKIEQQEYFSWLNKGRAEWNRYITQGPMHRIDFSDADLSKRNFKGFFFYSVEFRDTDLTDTVFEDCYLGYSDFSRAKLKNTVFKDSYLYGADFIDTDLSEADFTGAFGDKKDFRKALNAEKETAKLLDPEKCRWDGVQWYDFREAKWLKEKGVYAREPRGLAF